MEYKKLNKKGEIAHFQTYILAFLGAGIFLLSMYLFAVNAGNNPAYNVNFSIPNSQIDIISLTETLDATNVTTQEYEAAFTNASLLETDQELSLKGTWGVMKDGWNLIKLIFKVFSIGSYQIFGIPSWVINSVLLVLTVLLLFAAWKVMRSGG